MSRAGKYAAGIVSGYLNQVILLIGGLWLTRFLLGSFGQEQYGLWVLALQLLLVLELMDLGVVAVVPREVAYITGSHTEPGARTRAVREFVLSVQRVILCQVPLLAVAAALAWLALLQGEMGHPIALPLAAVAGIYVLLFPFRIYEAALRGLQDLLFLGVLGLAGWLVQTAVMVVLVLLGFGFWGLVAGWLVSRCLGLLGCRLRLAVAFPGAVPWGLWGGSLRSGLGVFRRGLWVSVSKLAGTLLNGTEVLLLGWLAGPAAVVVYVCSAKLAAIFTQQAYTLVTTAEPALSEIRMQGDASRLNSTSIAFSQLMLFTSGGLACVVLAVNQGFVTWWVGGEQFGGTALTVGLTLAMVTRHITFTLLHLLYCNGFERQLAWVALADGLTTTAATLVSVLGLGPVGVAVGSLSGVYLVSLPAAVYLVHYRTTLELPDLLRSYLPWLWRFGLLAFITVGLSLVWVPRTFLTLGASATAVVVLYAAVMWPALVRSQLWPYVVPRVAGLWPWWQRLSAWTRRLALCNTGVALPERTPSDMNG